MMTHDEISRFFSEEYIKKAFQFPDWPAGTEVVCYCRSTDSRSTIEQIAQRGGWKIVKYVHIDELPIGQLVDAHVVVFCQYDLVFQRHAARGTSHHPRHTRDLDLAHQDRVGLVDAVGDAARHLAVVEAGLRRRIGDERNRHPPRRGVRRIGGEMRPDRPLLGKPSRPRLRGLPLDLLLAGSLDDAERRAGHVRAEVVDADRNPVAGRVRKRVGLDVKS